MFLSRDKILAADDLPIVDVGCPEWGGFVFVRTLTAAQRDAFEAKFLKGTHDNVRAHLATMTVCDAGGNLLFAPADVEALGKKSGAVLTRIFEAAMKLNAVTKADVDELEKN